MCPLLRGFTVQFSHHCLSVRKLVRVPKRSHQEDEVVTFWGEEKPLQIAEKEQVSTEQACFHSLSSTTPSLLTSQWQRRWAKVRAAFSSDPHTDTQPTTPQLTTVEHMWKKWGGGRKKGKKGEIKKKKVEEKEIRLSRNESTVLASKSTQYCGTGRRPAKQTYSNSHKIYQAYVTQWMQHYYSWCEYKFLKYK